MLLSGDSLLSTKVRACKKNPTSPKKKTIVPVPKMNKRLIPN